MCVPEIQRLVDRQRAQIVGQIVRVRHGCSAHENGNHSHSAFERLSNLQAHEIARHIEPPASIFSDDCQPPLANYSKQHIAQTDLLFDHRRKIVAALDRVEIHVRVLSAEVDAENVEQPPCIPTAVFTAIADEYSRHLRPPRLALRCARSFATAPRIFPLFCLV